MADNMIDAYQARCELITANQDTPCIGAKPTSAMVRLCWRFLPRLINAVPRGQVVDAWQATIADVTPLVWK